MPRTKIVYVRRRVPSETPTEGGLTTGFGWLKATGAIMAVLLPLGYIAANAINKNTSAAIQTAQIEMTRRMYETMPSKNEFTIRREETNGRLEAIQRAIEHANTDMAAIQQTLREHGIAIAQMQAQQQVRDGRR
jgi:hypothetical protein